MHTVRLIRPDPLQFVQCPHDLDPLKDIAPPTTSSPPRGRATKPSITSSPPIPSPSPSPSPSCLLFELRLRRPFLRHAILLLSPLLILTLPLLVLLLLSPAR